MQSLILGHHRVLVPCYSRYQLPTHSFTVAWGFGTASPSSETRTFLLICSIFGPGYIVRATQDDNTAPDVLLLVSRCLKRYWRVMKTTGIVRLGFPTFFIGLGKRGPTLDRCAPGAPDSQSIPASVSPSSHTSDAPTCTFTEVRGHNSSAIFSSSSNLYHRSQTKVSNPRNRLR